MLIYMTLMVLLITFIPFEFHIPEHIFFKWQLSPRDFVRNIFLFLPLGFLYRQSRKIWKPPYIKALLFGVFFSLVIELSQAFIIGRFTSGYDVVANSIGMLLGVMCFEIMSRGLKEQAFSLVPTLQLPFTVSSIDAHAAVMAYMPVSRQHSYESLPSVAAWYLRHRIDLFNIYPSAAFTKIEIQTTYRCFNGVVHPVNHTGNNTISPKSSSYLADNLFLGQPYPGDLVNIQTFHRTPIRDSIPQKVANNLCLISGSVNTFS